MLRIVILRKRSGKNMRELPGVQTVRTRLSFDHFPQNEKLLNAGLYTPSIPLITSIVVPYKIPYITRWHTVIPCYRPPKKYRLSFGTFIPVNNYIVSRFLFKSICLAHLILGSWKTKALNPATPIVPFLEPQRGPGRQKRDTMRSRAAAKVAILKKDCAYTSFFSFMWLMGFVGLDFLAPSEGSKFLHDIYFCP